jgi:glycosyltransferase involved in cell wall biosynthesis
MRLLITGINWPPETFLRRLIDGLVDGGAEVTVGSAQKPEREARVKWLPTPSWDASLPLRLLRLAGMAARALLTSAADVKVLCASQCEENRRSGRSEMIASNCAERPKVPLSPRERDWGEISPNQGRTHCTTEPAERAALPPLSSEERGWGEVELPLPVRGETRSHRVQRFASLGRLPQNASQHLQTWNRLLPYAGRRWDIVYFPWNSAAIACLPVFDLGSPVVVSCRGTQVSVAPYNPERADIPNGLRATFAKAKAVHCVSQATLRDACRFGLDSARARVIRPAVDPDVFKPAPSRLPGDRPFSIITAGTLIWCKGHEWALQAIRRLVDDGVDVRFDIIGDGPDRQRVLYTIADLGLEARVCWLGRLAPEAVLARVQQADTFLLSSLSEGISNAALEAMACGVPIVTCDCGGMREAVTDGVEGFVVPVRDAEGLAGALLKLASDPALRERMGRAARARIEREFHLPGQIAQWLELLQSVMNRYPITAGAPLEVGLKHPSLPVANAVRVSTVSVPVRAPFKADL